MKNAQVRATNVVAGAKHKVEYELRTLLGIISSWKEVMSTQIEEPSIFIETNHAIENVYLNGKLLNK